MITLIAADGTAFNITGKDVNRESIPENDLDGETTILTFKYPKTA